MYFFFFFFFATRFHFLLGASVQEEEIMATLLGSESQQHTGRKRRNSSGNIVAKFTAVRITGKGFSRGTQVRENAVVFRDKRRRGVARSRPGSRAAPEAEHGDASPGIERGDAVALSPSPPLPSSASSAKANRYITAYNNDNTGTRSSTPVGFVSVTSRLHRDT